ncbi:NAD(+) diphosphatase [Cellulomonas soli]|uniref:NAD(+) diphosphatase n=1 Tax=Cellulomonas soli TaxID=931535 RepID=A0A512P8M2_9CELL|nr:NAD(+) diphosphatase [Cellulomonas soli]NYI57767.1 NAD+ diphosphatase [Cellulomonas soli]GEP67551.1 NTP pyrophosphohydrolase [Cellulomonas soli]
MVVDELPLSRAAVDRAAELRGRADLVAGALADERTRVLLLRDGLTAVDDEGVALLLLSPAQLRDVRAIDPAVAATGDDDGWVFLGRDDEGTHYLALHGPAPAEGQTPPTGQDGGVRFASLRVLGALLSARDAGLATTAVALAAWHANHRHCPRCGSPTRVTQAGWSRTCVQDGSEHYPRTDPAVIMAVVDDDDRLLLGHAVAWPAGRYSTLAGFVESGESLEHAVRREVLEETRVAVGEVEYRGSQPWPFPASLMLGFRARALSVEVTADGEEMGDARWFTRAELAEAVRDGSVVPPGRSSIARALIEEWFGGALPTDDWTA